MSKSALMDLRETAEYLQTSARSVERMTAANRLPGFRKLFNSQARWSRMIIDAWILADCPDDAAEFENKFRQAPPLSAK